MATGGEASPIGPEEARALFSPLEGASGLLAAVSGGPDSMALLALLAGWAKDIGPGEKRPALYAATVDHGLRPGSRAEAEAVADEAARLRVPHAVLDWTGPKPDSGVQAAARQSRYRLLSEEAARRGATHIVTAHHADDQAETVLMRLLHGSGIDGLAGMAPSRAQGGLVLARPFLSVGKARLVETASALGVPFVRDPSNEDPRFGRTRVRRLASVLAEEGLGTRQLATLAGRAARANAALEALASRAFEVHARWDEDRLRLSPALFEEPAELTLRVLIRAVGAFARRDEPQDGEPVRLARAERLVADLEAAVREGRSLRRTLAGCLVSLDRLGQVTIARETLRSRGSALFTSRKRPTDRV